MERKGGAQQPPHPAIGATSSSLWLRLLSIGILDPNPGLKRARTRARSPRRKGGAGEKGGLSALSSLSEKPRRVCRPQTACRGVGLLCPPLPLHLASPKPLSAAQVCCQLALAADFVPLQWVAQQPPHPASALALAEFAKQNQRMRSQDGELPSGLMWVLLLVTFVLPPTPQTTQWMRPVYRC